MQHWQADPREQPFGRDMRVVAPTAAIRAAWVVAITASYSPLAKKADVALIADHVEDVATHVPMVSRILHLLVIDILAVGVAMRLGQGGADALPQGADAGAGHDEGERAAPAEPAVGRRVAPGVSSAGPLARLSSHSR